MRIKAYHSYDKGWEQFILLKWSHQVIEGVVYSNLSVIIDEMLQLFTILFLIWATSDIGSSIDPCSSCSGFYQDNLPNYFNWQMWMPLELTWCSCAWSSQVEQVQYICLSLGRPNRRIALNIHCFFLADFSALALQSFYFTDEVFLGTCPLTICR